MDISLLLTPLAGPGRTVSQADNDSGQTGNGFAQALASLEAASQSLALPASMESDTRPGGSGSVQASLVAMMQALGGGSELKGNGDLAEIAERLALIASAGAPTDNTKQVDSALEATRSAQELTEGTPLADGYPPALAESAVAPLLPRESNGRAAGLEAREPRLAAADIAQQRESRPVADSLAATLSSNPAGRELPAQASRAQGLTEAVARAVESPQAPGASELRPAAPAEWRSEGLAGLSAPPTGASAPSAAIPGMSLPAALSAPLASPAWPGQLGQQLVMLGQRGGEQRVELHLNPAELGPLTISLKMSEQGAQAQFLSAHAPVRQAVEQAIPQLREALAEQGISLGETSVGEHRQQDQGERQALAGGAGTPGAAIDSEELESAGSAAPLSAQPLEAGRVDFYA
ncbi:MAG: flagellar hook-length control protein FliK [Halomonas sp.]|uniref:flagellar hook-length control protein FliK n=1 Tax=Halomonas sp. TaxID=1486246 RepID=UPI0019FE7728|nr:flagellar hook-length control protein FliK [Halomonas sp.]MBE0489181.1 flagellar hook-length control protein FliK [Halomonas sp.]